MPQFGPARELGAFLIEKLREDEALNSYLFAGEAAVDANDHRIWLSDVELPENLRPILPRVLIEIITDSSNWEQETGTDDGPAEVWTHTFTPRDQADLGEYIDARIRTVIGSTWVSTARILGGELIQTGRRVKAREPLFNDARRLSTPYAIRNIGVIAS